MIIGEDMIVDCYHLTEIGSRSTTGACEGPPKAAYTDERSGATVIVAPAAWVEAWAAGWDESGEPPDLTDPVLTRAVRAWDEWLVSARSAASEPADTAALALELLCSYGITGQEADVVIAATIDALSRASIVAASPALPRHLRERLAGILA